MASDKILSGEDYSGKSQRGGILGSDKLADKASTDAHESSSLTDRIFISTKSGGLKSLPDRFDDVDGDWQCINSSNPFEILYLDYKQYKFLTTEVVSNNHSILDSFWKEKNALLNTGGNRVAFKNKFGDGTVENSQRKLKNALDKLSSEKGINDYYLEINSKRLAYGESELQESIEDMLSDGVAEISEIELRLNRGVERFDLDKEETAEIIKRVLDKRGFVPFGEVKGDSLALKLLSVDWLTPSKFEERKKEEEEKQKRGREIFENQYAYDLEDIGEILFNNESEAKEYLADELIASPISYFSAAKAKQIKDITKNQENHHLQYLQVIYRLNSKLPYRFSNDKLAASPKELAAFFNETVEDSNLGKEHLKKGYPEIWLAETNPDAHGRAIEIRDSADNLDLAFIEFIYSFNSSLPYRFAGRYLVNTPEELSLKIDENYDNWKYGEIELYGKHCLVWLSTVGQSSIVDAWEKINLNDKYQKDTNPHVGLEEFLHALNPKLEQPQIELNIAKVGFPAIQSGKSELVNMTITNTTRGYVEGDISFSTELDGVYVSNPRFACSKNHDGAATALTLTIDTSNLTKGVPYHTNLLLTPSRGAVISLPIEFEVVFPRNAFVLEILKWSAIIAAFMAGTRFALQKAGYYGWLKDQFGFYLESGVNMPPTEELGGFVAVFFLFSITSIVGLYFLFRYLLSTNRQVATNDNPSVQTNTRRGDITDDVHENPSTKIKELKQETKIPKEAIAHYENGYRLHERQSFNEAIKHYDLAIAVDPKYSLVFVLRGMAKYSINDRSGAELDWRAASDLGNEEGDKYIARYFNS